MTKERNEQLFSVKLGWLGNIPWFSSIANGFCRGDLQKV
jgi:hypothetical protein